MYALPLILLVVLLPPLAGQARGLAPSRVALRAALGIALGFGADLLIVLDLVPAALMMNGPAMHDTYFTTARFGLAALLIVLASCFVSWWRRGAR